MGNSLVKANKRKCLSNHTILHAEEDIHPKKNPPPFNYRINIRLIELYALEDVMGICVVEKDNKRTKLPVTFI